MVEHDRLIGKGAGEIEDIAELRFEHPGIEAQPEPRIGGEARSERVGAIKAFRRVEGRAEHVGVRIPGGGMADALEAAIPGGDQRLDHRSDRIAQCEVRMSHDPCAGAILAVESARTLRRHPIRVFDFADRLHRSVAIGGVIGPAFHEDGRKDAMRGRIRRSADIRPESIEIVIGRARNRLEKRMPRTWEGGEQGPQIPQMVMGIDDRQIGFDYLFGHCLISP